MSEPPRFLDEPHSALERSLLEAGRSYTASASTRRRALTALGVASLATSSTAAASSFSKAGLAKWAAVAALAGGGALAAAHFLAQPAPSVSAWPSAVVVSAHGGAPLVAPPLADPGAVPVPVVDESALPTESALPSAPVNAPRAEPKAALAAELSALDSVRARLNAGQPKAALSSLDAYSRTFPRGRLGLEAEVLRIDALAKSGQTASARSRAEAFIKRHPDSVLASRVRGYVGL